MPKLSRRHGYLLFAVIQSGITCAVTGAIASAPLLAAGDFVGHWLKSWLLSWLTMLPVVSFAAPHIRRMVDGLTRET